MITTQINEQDHEPNTFPILMQMKDEPDCIVLFVSPSYGCVVSETIEPRANTIGAWSCSWHMDQFEPFCGTLELRNS